MSRGRDNETISFDQATNSPFICILRSTSFYILLLAQNNRVWKMKHTILFYQNKIFFVSLSFVGRSGSREHNCVKGFCSLCYKTRVGTVNFTISLFLNITLFPQQSISIFHKINDKSSSTLRKVCQFPHQLWWSHLSTLKRGLHCIFCLLPKTKKLWEYIWVNIKINGQ